MRHPRPLPGAQWGRFEAVAPGNKDKHIADQIDPGLPKLSWGRFLLSFEMLKSLAKLLCCDVGSGRFVSFLNRFGWIPIGLFETRSLESPFVWPPGLPNSYAYASLDSDSNFQTDYIGTTNSKNI